MTAVRTLFAAAGSALVVAACAVVVAPSRGPSEQPSLRSPAPAALPTAGLSSAASGASSIAPAGFSPTGPTQAAEVVRVVDGDTIVVAISGVQYTLRYIGMDTPETVKPDTPVQWMGPEATAANKRLVEGQHVVLEKDVSETDRYGRLLRYVWLYESGEWILVNLELVREGYAQVSTFPPDVKYVDAYLAAQREARDASLGLWGTPPATPTPLPGASDGGYCDPAYPTVCIPPPPPDLDCADIPYRRFAVLPPDPHHFDGDGNGIGCENVSTPEAGQP